MSSASHPASKNESPTGSRQARPPTRSRASRTATSTPPCASRYAAARPEPGAHDDHRASNRYQEPGGAVSAWMPPHSARTAPFGFVATYIGSTETPVFGGRDDRLDPLALDGADDLVPGLRHAGRVCDELAVGEREDPAVERLGLRGHVFRPALGRLAGSDPGTPAKESEQEQDEEAHSSRSSLISEKVTPSTQSPSRQ